MAAGGGVQERRPDPAFAAAVEINAWAGDLINSVVISDLRQLSTTPVHPLLPKLFIMTERTPHYVVFRTRPGTAVNYRNEACRTALRTWVAMGATVGTYYLQDHECLHTMPMVVPMPEVIVRSAAWPPMSIHSVPWGRLLCEYTPYRTVRLHFDGHVDDKLLLHGCSLNTGPAWTVPVLFPRGMPVYLSPTSYIMHVPRHKL